MKNIQKPLVSISCITYNHAKYIRDTIEGFLMQKTNFEFEILIHDDASTDGTIEIIKEYEKKHTNLIKPIYQIENQWSKGIKISPTFLWPKAQGKYIALCEGDDYWTDPYKLQKQVDFLERNNDVSLCFHPSELIIETNSIEKTGMSNLEERYYSGKEIIDQWTIPTASVVFRNVNINKIIKRLENPNYIYGDIILFLSLLEEGKIYCINKIMSVYRRHNQGITQTIVTDTDYLEKLYKHRETIANDFNKKYKYLKYKELSFAYFSLALNYIKNFKTKGILFIIKAIYFNPRVIISYLKHKL